MYFHIYDLVNINKNKDYNYFTERGSDQPVDNLSYVVGETFVLLFLYVNFEQN